jgi:alkanesulfonate monooxygenase SsuD/methylene tetrahydromethanopterin reductase-like flavin-dependent oxidoreductase (luciferase family)
MKFGTFQLQSIPPWTNAHDVVRQQWEQMMAAERLGYYELWLAEHNGRPYGMIGNTVTLAAALAAATQQIRIATAVVRLPLHNPTHLAEDLCYVDNLSRGRLDWGVGKGYDLHEFSTYGINHDLREELWQETFDAVRQMIASGRTEWNGKHFQLADGELLPPPLFPGDLSTYVMVSGSEASVLWAAQHGLPIAIGSGPGWDDTKTRLDMYADEAARNRIPDSVIRHNLANTWQLRQVHVAGTTERAIREYERGLMWYMDAVANRAMFGFAREHKPYEYYVEHKAVVIGSPEKILDELHDYSLTTGINNIICWFNLGGQPHTQVMNALELFCAEVMPKLKDHGYDWSTRTSEANAATQAPAAHQA